MLRPDPGRLGWDFTTAFTVTDVYATGASPALSALLLVVTITSLGYVIGHMRLEPGSVWPAIVRHAAWNSIVVGGFDSVNTGPEAALWMGGSGVLTALTLIVAAFLISRRRWTGFLLFPDHRDHTRARRQLQR